MTTDDENEQLVKTIAELRAANARLQEQAMMGIQRVSDARAAIDAHARNAAAWRANLANAKSIMARAAHAATVLCHILRKNDYEGRKDLLEQLGRCINELLLKGNTSHWDAFLDGFTDEVDEERMAGFEARIEEYGYLGNVDDEPILVEMARRFLTERDELRERVKELEGQSQK